VLYALRILPTDMDQKSGLAIQGIFKFKSILKNLQGRNGKGEMLTYQVWSCEVKDTVTLQTNHELEIQSQTEQA